VFCLTESTNNQWIAKACSDVNAILVDHTHCEHKAAVTALAFISKYPDDAVLVSRLAELAEEEAGHFRQMVAVCLSRGLELGHPGADPYVRALLGLTQETGWKHRADRLLICALIEARSCERLKLLAEHLEDPELKTLYGQFWRAEVSHYSLFVDLAVRTRQQHRKINEPKARSETEARLHQFAIDESRILRELPIRAAIH
jgi:tRNA 2-(methylsulfanyl)-N6-isopentenyladenosine37 hydroxylase